MEKTWYKIFNYVTIVIAVIVAVLLLLDKIPGSYYVPLLFVMIIIFILRIVVRFYLEKISKKQT